MSDIEVTIPWKIIDSDYYDRAGFKAFFFPGGEPNAILQEPHFYKDSRVILFLKLRTWNDVGLAACVVDIIRRHAKRVVLFIPYFPSARQDKRGENNTAPFTPDIVKATLGIYGLPIYTFDIHSKVSLGSNMINLMPSDLVCMEYEMSEIDGIISPDHGAVDRATNFHDKFCPQADILVCEKHRDQNTGKIVSFSMDGELKKSGRYMIVDDICDGGWTFNEVAKAFEQKENADTCRLELFVSHGIFSKGLENLSPRISKVYTTDSYTKPEFFQKYSLSQLQVFWLGYVLERIAKEQTHVF